MPYLPLRSVTLKGELYPTLLIKTGFMTVTVFCFLESLPNTWYYCTVLVKIKE